MAIEFIQFSAATATTGAIVAADRIDFSGGATDVSVQVIKFGYGTDGVYNEVATDQGLPVLIELLPTTATLAVRASTGPLYSVQQAATATSPVSITTWAATAIVVVEQAASATSPVSILSAVPLGVSATIPVSVSTAATHAVTLTNTGLPSTATVPVVLSSLPSSATIPITGTITAGAQYAESVTATASATGFLGNIMLGEDSDDTLRIIKTDATGNLLFSALSSATLPVSVGNTATVQLATGTRVYLIQQMTTSTSPVSIASAVPLGVSATIPVSVSTAATQAVTITNTATVAISGNVNANVGGRWAHDATSTGNPVYLAAISEETFPAGVSADGDVTQLIADRHGRLIVMPFGSRQNRVKSHITASATTVATLATGAGTAGVFRDLVTLVAFNSATSEARIRIRSSSTSTEFIFNLAADGGGIMFNPQVPWPQAIAATTWDVTLTSALTGTDALTIAAMFLETT